MLQADRWGQFYSDGGEPTEALLQVEAALEEGQTLKDQAQWSAARRGRVWWGANSSLNNINRCLLSTSMDRSIHSHHRDQSMPWKHY
uniref:Uncharacterized protein n=1 Tax=Oncorhynchus mykiss TaxID=8022 RepID=A0A8C7T1X9_ONCMY